MQNISELRKKVNSLNEKKEKLYNKQSELSNKIKEEVEKIKNLKSETDNSNLKLSELRKARDEENRKVKELIVKIKDLREKKKLILQKHNIKEPERASRRIEGLERKIETEALSPSQEKKFMKQLNVMKKIFGKNSELSKVSEGIRDFSSKLKEAKNRGDECHNKLRELGKRGGYGSFKDISKKITELRKKQKEFYSQFSEIKREYLEESRKLKEEVKKLKKERVKKQMEKDKINSLKVIKIHNLAKKVEDKLKKKERLTTEDLLAFQAGK